MPDCGENAVVRDAFIASPMLWWGMQRARGGKVRRKIRGGVRVMVRGRVRVGMRLSVLSV